MKCYLNITEQGHMWTIEEAHIRAKNGFSIAQYTEEDLIAQRHSHNFFQIHYVKEGSLIHDVKDTSVVLSAGDLFVVPPYVYHELRTVPGRPLVYMSINFETYFLRKNDMTDDLPVFISYLLSNSTNNTFPKIYIGNDSLLKVRQIIDEMYTEFLEQQDGFVYLLHSLLVQLLIILGRNFTSNQSKTSLTGYRAYAEPLNRCLDYIQTHFTENIKLDDVVKLSMTSRTNFCKYFKMLTNTTFNEYINHLRINYAKEQLQYSQFSMTEIAVLCGFSDASSFSRKFKEVTGISPILFRKKS